MYELLDWCDALADANEYGVEMAFRILIAFVILTLLRTPVRANSIFSRFEYRSFWTDVLPILLMVGFGIIATWQVRKKVSKQLATAPAEALRNQKQRLLHRLSLLMLVMPMAYAFLFDVDQVLPFGGILVSQSLGLVILRALSLSFVSRLLSLFPIGLISILAGNATAEYFELPPAVSQVWPHAISATCFAIGSLLSYLSFPPTYRERAW